MSLETLWPFFLENDPAFFMRNARTTVVITNPFLLQQFHALLYKDFVAQKCSN